MAGQSYKSSGGSSQPLCLPFRPQYNEFEGNAGTDISPAEYRLASQATVPYSSALSGHDVPCAVCLAKGKSTTIMLPARTKCPKGLRSEYSGYLMTGSPKDFGRTEYSCVAGNAASVPDGQRDLPGGYHLFTVAMKCGGPVPCTNDGQTSTDSYVAGRELPCVVCSA